MATSATHGFGIVLKYDTQANMGSGSAVTVGQVETIGDISLVCDDIEVTNHASTTSYNAKATKEYIPGNIEAGEVSLVLIYTENNLKQYITTSNMLADRTATHWFWQILFTDASYWTFHGYVKQIGMSGMSTTDALRINMTIKIDGAYASALPTFTQYSP